MATTPSIEASEARVFTIFDATTPTISLSEARLFALINFPTVEEQASQVRVFAPILQRTDIEVSEARVFAIVRGRIENRRLRAWAYSLDGHDFYVLRLGEQETLVCDLATGQWSEWASPGLPYWRAHIGGNWLGMAASVYASGVRDTVIAGDDTVGLLWLVDPDGGMDESPREDRPDAPFARMVTGGIPMQMRETARCGAVYATISCGDPAYSGASITLRTSDDVGKTWTDHGALTVTPGDWDQEFSWRSLGLIRAPGRIFSIEDDGATARIAGADMR